MSIAQCAQKLFLCIGVSFSGCYSSQQLSQSNILLTTIKFKTFQDYFVKFKDFKAFNLVLSNSRLFKTTYPIINTPLSRVSVTHLSHGARVKVAERDTGRLTSGHHATRQTVPVQRPNRDRMELTVVRGSNQQTLPLLDGPPEHRARRHDPHPLDGVHLVYLQGHSRAT